MADLRNNTITKTGIRAGRCQYRKDGISACRPGWSAIDIKLDNGKEYLRSGRMRSEDFA